MTQGTLYIISAPSGAGKTSLVKKLLQEMDALTVSVSHTTRTMRVGEVHGSDYFFVTIADFKQKITEQAFLEYAQVFDNFYGTTQQAVEENLQKGSDVILEIDWQGAAQIREKMPHCESIFILPPSIDVLQHRLQARGQDSAEIIARRMAEAVTEMSHFAEFDYLVVNDDFQQALTELKSILLANRLRKKQQQPKLTSLLQNLFQN